MSDRASVTLARWNAMKTARMNWDVRWDDCARYISPRKGNILTKMTPGQDQTINIYDTTAEEALGIAAAGTITHIVPAGEKWFRFQPKGKNPSQAYKEWLDQVGEITLSAIYASNFYQGIHEDLLDSFCFGSALLLEEEGKKNTLNFINVPVGTFAFEENAEGIVDTVGREWKWSARQAEQKWGRDKLAGCKALTKALTDTDPNACQRQFTFVHFVEPRDVAYYGGPVVGTGRPWRSCYVCVEDQCEIEEGGYYSMPYFGQRLLRSNNEVYGRGPGIQTLAEIKMVNAMERDILVAIEKMVSPGWLKPEDASYRMDNRPNAENYWDTSNPLNKPEQIQYKNQVDLGEQKTEQKRQKIRRAFFNDLFQMLTTIDEQKREKTAYEVQQMVAEKLLLFSPLFARLVMELLNPLLERTVDILARAGMFPEMPAEAMDGAEYEIVYTSKIALAIKSAENQAFATMVQLVTNVAQLDPSVVNLVKWRDGIRGVGSNVGLPSSLMRSDREIDQITAEQQKAAQAQQMAETAKAGAGAMKDAAEAQAVAA